jgi:hypothetical protein
MAAAILFAVSVTLRWPGVAMYDSVAQYGEALSGDFSDWHPPVMARTWALLNHLHAGTEPFFLIQLALWWGGLGLLAAALGRQLRHGAAGFVLLVGASPLLLGWATVVLKDAQMAACLVAATGLAAWWRLDGRVPPLWAKAAMLLLILYATLVRGNAAFATVPFALALFGWGGVARPLARTGLAIALVAAALGLSGLVNHRLLGAEPSHVARTLPVYDLAGIAHFTHAQTIPGLAPGQWRAAEAKGCYTAYYWNPYGEPAECGFVGDALAFDEGRSDGLVRTWASQVVRHPIAYARHRIGHLNSNLRLWVGPEEGDAIPPLDSEVNEYGLGARATPAGKALIDAATVMAASPLGWPYLWLALAVGLLWASARAEGDGQVRLGRALLLSAACMSASFAVVSIASDLRYHLWSMTAAALGLILLADARAIDRGRGIALGWALVVLTVIGSAGRGGWATPVHQPHPIVAPIPAA